MISAFFVRRPTVAIVIAIATVLGGLVSMARLPIAMFPDIVPPQIIVQATYTGADAVTVEQSVATPLEQQMNGVDNMLYMQSTNANDGTMQLTVTFGVETDPNIDQVNVQNRNSQAQPNLPAEVNQFGLTLRKSTGLPLIIPSLRSPNHTYDALFLANYANINIIDRLARVPGVGQVIIFGANDYAMRIWLKPDRLAAMGLTVTDIANAISSRTPSTPRVSSAEPAQAGVDVHGPRAKPAADTRRVWRDRAACEPRRVGGANERRRAHRARGAHLQSDRPREWGAGRRYCRLSDTRIERHGRRARHQAGDERAQRAVSAGPRVCLRPGQHAACVGGDERDRADAGSCARARHPGRLRVPAELARDPHPDARGAGVARRHLRGVSPARVLDQHAVAVRARARDRSGRRRCESSSSKRWSGTSRKA
jgi:AcrB/AcrD/AcrF family